MRVILRQIGGDIYYENEHLDDCMMIDNQDVQVEHIRWDDTSNRLAITTKKTCKVVVESGGIWVKPLSYTEKPWEFGMVTA